jgi:hypothetical protein
MKVSYQPSIPDVLLQGKKSPHYLLDKRLGQLRANLDAIEKRNFLHLLVIQPLLVSLQHSHYAEIPCFNVIAHFIITRYIIFTNIQHFLHFKKN